MEAIRHVDPRITWGDIWARLSVFPFLVSRQQKLTNNSPEKCGKGGIYGPNALSDRATRFRLENCIPARIERRGSKELRNFMLGLMSPAAIAANSTRELSKLSDEQQMQAKRLNKGKHDTNAGGYGLKINQRGGSAPRKARKAVAKKRKPASSQSHKDKRRQLPSGLDFHEDTEHQPLSFASEHHHTNERQKPNGSTPSTEYASPDSVPGEMCGYAPLESSLHFGLANNDFGHSDPSSGTYEYMTIGPAFAAPSSYIPPFDTWEGSSSDTLSTLNTPTNGRDLSMLAPFGDIDHQYIPPQITEHAQAIPEGFMTTQAQFHPCVMNDWPSTSTANQSYMFQMNELSSHFHDTMGPRIAQVAPCAGSSGVSGDVERGFQDSHRFTGTDGALFHSVMARDWSGGV